MKFEGIKKFEDRLVPAPKGFRMPDRDFPWSITPKEGRFLYEITRLAAHVLPAVNGRRSFRAVELATGFGYSGAWLASGIADGVVDRGFDPHFLTIDSYAEEQTDDKFHTHSVNAEPQGLQFAKTAFDLVDTLDFTTLLVDSSPGVFVPLRGIPFDLFYLDGHHLNGQPLVDWQTVHPHLMHSKTVTLFHDAHVEDVKVAIREAERYYGRDHFNPTLGGFNLVVITDCDEIRTEFSRIAKACRNGDPYK